MSEFLRYARNLTFAMADPQTTPNETSFNTKWRNLAIEIRAKELMRAILDENRPISSVKAQENDDYWNELFLLVRQPVLTLLGYVFGIVNADAQDDLFQMVMMRFYRYHRSYNLTRPFLPWLYAIARNVKLEWMEKSKHKLESALITPPDSHNDLDRKLTVKAVLAKLPEDDRHILWLFYNEGLTAEEISEHLHLQLSATKFRLRRARKRAHEILTTYTPRGGEPHEV
jgi:RNA polymerase sigma factor (sigma-70 family)